MSNTTTARQPTLDARAAAYLDLMKRCVTRAAFPEDHQPLTPRRGTWQRAVYEPIRRLLARRDLELVHRVRSDPESRLEGLGWPAHAETMVGLRRLDDVQDCVVSALQAGVPGDLVETGVWRGGTSIFMRAILRAMGDTQRTVWVADSFDGLPKPDAKRWPADEGDSHSTQRYLAVSQIEVEANFKRYGLLDDQVRFLPGWFEDTLPTAPIDQIAVLRLDGDMYGSTMEALEALYPRVSPEGFLLVDDYGALEQCRRAVDDYRRRLAIEEPIRRVDWTGVSWQKTAASEPITSAQDR